MIVLCQPKKWGHGIKITAPHILLKIEKQTDYEIIRAV